MKKSKKVISLLMVFVMMIAMTACGGGSTETTKAAESTTAAAGETSDAAAGESSSADEVGAYEWFLAVDASEDTVTYLYATKFADLVNQYSDGKMVIDVMSNGVLGSDKHSMESIKSEDGISFAVMTTANQVSFMPKLAVFDIPCPYQDIESVRKAIDDPAFMEQIDTIHKEGGYKLLGYADQMFRVMTSNKKIETLEDFSGIKIRTMENSNHMAFWKALGANPTPMSFSEVYTSLQNKTIDAQENPYEVIVGNKLYEPQDYVIETNHIPHLLSLITADQLYERLNDSEKAILDQAAAEAKVWAREQADNRVQDRLTIIQESGTEIVPVSEELYNQIVEAAQSVYQEIRTQVGDELVDAYLSQK